MWTSIWSGLIFELRLVQSFFPVQKAVLHSILDSNHQLWELSNTRTWSFKEESQQSSALDVVAKPKLLWMSRRMKPWACVSWRVYRAAFVALSVPCQCQVCLHLQCLKQLVKQLKNEFPKNLQKLSSFLFLKSPTLLSPPRHVLGFLGVLSPFLIKMFPNQTCLSLSISLL